MTENEAIDTIEGRRCDFGKFLSLWVWICDHSFEHLRLKENWFCFGVHLLDCPLLSNCQFFCSKLPSKFISYKYNSISLFLNFLELFNSIHTINLCKNSYAFSSISEKLSQLMNILITWRKWQSNIIDNDVLGNLTQIKNILICNRSKMSMLSRSKSNLRVAFHDSTNFDFHSGRTWLDINDDTYNFAVIKIDNIIWFQNFLHFRCVNSEIIWVRRLIILSSNKINNRSSSDFHLVISIYYLGDSDLSASEFNHEATWFMWS